MKRSVAITLFLSLAVSAPAEDGPVDHGPTYVSESPLPEGWPTPGPYNTVVEKTFPDTRAAVIDARNRNLGFWTLFNHIQRNDIPMTAPVEMGMETTGPDSMRMRTMAFLYESTSVGVLGKEGRKVEVTQTPSVRALTYAFQGRDTKLRVNQARKAIDARLKEIGVEATGYRLLGYNGPGTPDSQKTWELQALLEGEPALSSSHLDDLGRAASD